MGARCWSIHGRLDLSYIYLYVSDSVSIQLDRSVCSNISKIETPKMISYVLVITGLIITLAAVSQAYNIEVWVGDQVDLQCGDNSDSARRFWNKGSELLTAGQDIVTDDDRISLANRSAILRIVNVTMTDADEYKCIVYTKPRYTNAITLQVKEVECDRPENPLNGHYESETGDPFRTGDTVRYSCIKGYELVGQAIRTCTGTYRGWSSEEPHCEPEYIGRLMRKLVGIEDRVTTLENDTGDSMTAMGNRLASVESRLSTVESNTSSLWTFHPVPTKETEEHLTQCSKEEPMSPDTQSKCMTMQSSVRDGRSVSVFKWVVKDISSMLPTKQQFSKEIDSQAFYQSVPGYKFLLRLNLYYDRSFSLYFKLLQSEYDDQLQWPFNPISDVVIVMNDGDKESVIYNYSIKQHEKMNLKRPLPSSDLLINTGTAKGDTLTLKFFMYKQ